MSVGSDGASLMLHGQEDTHIFIWLFHGVTNTVNIKGTISFYWSNLEKRNRSSINIKPKKTKLNKRSETVFGLEFK